MRVKHRVLFASVVRKGISFRVTMILPGLENMFLREFSDGSLSVSTSWVRNGAGGGNDFPGQRRCPSQTLQGMLPMLPYMECLGIFPFKKGNGSELSHVWMV